MQHSTRSLQHAVFNTQHSTRSIQRAAFNTKYSTRSLQHAVFNTQYSTRSIQRAAFNAQHSTRSIQHEVFNAQHSTRSIQLYSPSVHLSLSSGLNFQGAKLFSILLNIPFHSAGALLSSMIRERRNSKMISNGLMLTGHS